MFGRFLCNFPTTCIFDVVKNFELILRLYGVKRKAHGNSSVKVLSYQEYEDCYCINEIYFEGILGSLC